VLSHISVSHMCQSLISCLTWLRLVWEDLRLWLKALPILAFPTDFLWSGMVFQGKCWCNTLSKWALTPLLPPHNCRTVSRVTILSYAVMNHSHLAVHKLNKWQWTHIKSRILHMKLIVTQLIKKFPTFYGTHKFITLFTRACLWSLSWARWIQSTPSHHISLRSILMLSFHPGLGLPSGLFASGFLTKNFDTQTYCHTNNS